MNRLLAVGLLAIGLSGAIVGSLRAEVTAENVRQAIERGVNYLMTQQHRDGSWLDYGGYPGGTTALCTLALLNSGVDPTDDKIQKALAFLRQVPPTQTYVVSLQTMVFARAEPEKDRALIGRNIRWLESAQVMRGRTKGSWSYQGSDGRDGDNSNAQFALLAMHEAERVGVPANDRAWNFARKYWESCQNPDGSWSYSGGPPTGSMTCAGITSLVIAADKVQSSDARVDGDHIECCVPHGAKDNRIERGLQWLGQHFSVTANPGTTPGWRLWHLYYLYGLERAGRLTAQRFLPLSARGGRADWYREGADALLRDQDSLSGFWSGANVENNSLISTSFALLFLSKGRWPGLLGKLQHGAGDDWNHHRSDVANLTRYVETRWKRDLTWQVVDVRLATVEEMLQVPVLYFCGDKSPLPEDAVERKALARKLRDYVDRGGFLLAEGYCGGAGFDKGFRELMLEVFSEPEYKLQLLEKEHPIWYAEEKIDPQQLRPLWGVEAGCRTSVVYVPPDPPQDPQPSLSCLWELARPGRGEKYSPVVQAKVNAALSLGLNVLAYATNRELKSREEFPASSAAQGPAARIERGRLSVAKLRHPGGCNAAPRALANLMESAGRELKIRTHVEPEPLDITSDALFNYNLVFMHGRTAFHLTDAERQRLAQYIERGGMLFADSICASRAFTESFRREMAAIFPNRKLERIPVTDPLLSKDYGGFELRTVSRRDPSSGGKEGRLAATVREKVPPDLEGIKFGERWSVIFSQYDVSCALEKRDSLECQGYLREDAARIGLNVLLYSLQ